MPLKGPRAIPGAPNDPEIGKDILGMIQNPLRALLYPVLLPWKLLRPAVGMSNESITKVPERLIDLVVRANIGAMRYGTRLAASALMALPILPAASGRTIGGAMEKTREKLRPILRFPGSSPSATGAT